MLGITFIGFLIIAQIARNELVSVVEITIPGAQSPVTDIPPGEYYEEGLSDLTPIGLRQHYVLGYYHKSKWAQKFLDGVYNGDQFYSRSINTNASIQSTYAHTMGIYPYNANFTLDTNQIRLARPPVFNDSIFDYVETILGPFPLPFKFYPIPVHVFDPTTDPLDTYSCKNANTQREKEFNDSSDVTAIMTQYNAVINEEVLTIYKLPQTNSERNNWIRLLFDILAADFDSRATGLHVTTLRSLREMADKLIPFYYYGKGEATAKLRAHRFNEMLSDIFDDVVSDYLKKTKEERICYTLLMTTDTMMGSLLKSWGFDSTKMIPYASSILISVTRADDHNATKAEDFTVKVAYSHEKGKPADILNVCAGVADCKINTFLDALNKARVQSVKNITEACGTY